MGVTFRKVLLVLGVLSLTACAQAAARTYSDASPLEPLPSLVTSTAPDSGNSVPKDDAVPASTPTSLPPTSEMTLVEVGTIGGDIAPKSVISTGHGLFFAQNMMYRHTVTVYDEDRKLVATIPDTITLSDFGFGTDGSSYQGAPVEGVATHDGAYVYVSNYQMYGPGYANPGGDTCDPGGWDQSFVYRIATSGFDVDQVIPVGAVPKYVALTPDDGTLLVTNWCSYDLSIVDTATARETDRIYLGRHPRGIAVTSDGSTAYVAVMGSTSIAAIDLDTLEVEWMNGVGNNPRHLVLSPDNRYLYATLNGDDRVIRIDLESRSVVDRISTGDAPRSMAISDDGLSLYIVDYGSDTLAKVDTTSMTVDQEIPVAHHPIGVTFDSPTRSVWVASYSGVITVFAERNPG